MAKPQIRIKGFDGEWCKNRLVDTVLLYNGLTYAPSDIREKGTLVLRSSNVQQDEITLTDNVYVNPSVVNSPFVQKGDIIVVVRNGSRELIGKHAQIKTSLTNCVIGAFMAGIRGENPEFVNALLSTKSFKDEVTKNLGATINQITNGTFRKMEFFFPQQDEQKAIGTYFRSLDALIQAAAKKIDSLKQMKAACLQSMFPQPGETAPKVRFKGFTGDWETKMLNECLDISTEKNLDNNFGINDVLSVSDDFGVINQIQLLGRSYAGKSVSNYGILKNGEIVYTKSPLSSKPYGIVKYNPGDTGIVSVLYAIYRAKEGVSAEFIHYYFDPAWRLNAYLRPLVNKGAKNTMNISDEMALNGTIIIPNSLQEQEQIASFFHEMDNQIRLHEQRLGKLKQIKASCLDKMFV